MEDVKIEPLRSMDDFLLSSARFQIPNFSDVDRWNFRVKANLVYYQTNYFLMSIIIFLIVGIMHPAQMMLGLICVGGVYGGYTYLCQNQDVIQDIQKKYPVIGLIAILTSSYTIVSLLGSVMVLLFGIVLPLSAVFIHASLRLRNTKNKLSSVKELLSVKKSPMTLLLDQIGVKLFEEGVDE